MKQEVNAFNRRIVIDTLGLYAFLFFVAGVVCLVLFLFFLSYAWPLSPILLVSVIGWLTLRHREAKLAKATAGFLGCVSLGMGILLFLLLGVTACTAVFSSFNAEQALRHTENFAADAGEYAEKLKGRWMLLAIAVVLVIAHYAPGRGVMTRFIRLKEVFAQTSLVLAVILSYSFFTAGPVDHVLQGRYTLLHEKYEKDRQRVLAARAIQAEAGHMDEPTRRYYRTLFTAIHEQAGEQAETIAEKMGERDAQAIRETAPKDGVSRGGGAEAQAGNEAAAPTRLGDLDLAERSAAKESNEALEGATAAVSQALGMIAGEHLEGIIKEYVDVLAERVGDFVTGKTFHWASGALTREQPPTEEAIREEIKEQVRELPHPESPEKPPERDMEMPHR
jgi:hypothetical protein